MKKKRTRKSALEAINNAGSVEEIVSAFRDVYEVGNVSYFTTLTFHGEMTDAPYVRTTYPDAWISRYLIKGYVTIDPVMKVGLAQISPFHWKDLDVDETGMEMMVDFAQSGFSADGFSIPVIDRIGRRAVFSINAQSGDECWMDRVECYQKDWIFIAGEIHKLAISELFGENDSTPILSKRELDTLLWSARGKNYKEIAIILGLSDHTIRTYMSSARSKLDSVSLSQAIAEAIRLQLIKP